MNNNKNLKEYLNYLQQEQNIPNNYNGQREGAIEHLERLSDAIDDGSVLQLYESSSGWNKSWIYNNLCIFNLISGYPEIEKKVIKFEILNSIERIRSAQSHINNNPDSRIGYLDGYYYMIILEMELKEKIYKILFYINKIKNEKIEKLIKESFSEKIIKIKKLRPDSDFFIEVKK